MPGPHTTRAVHPYYYRDLAPRLLANGYRVFPAWPGTKRPAIRRWPRFCHEMPSREQVLRWRASSVPYGILLALGRSDQGISYSAIDLDEDDPERAAQLLMLTKRVLGETELVRIGKPHRRVLLYALSPGISASRNLHEKVQLCWPIASASFSSAPTQERGNPTGGKVSVQRMCRPGTCHDRS